MFVLICLIIIIQDKNKHVINYSKSNWLANKTFNLLLSCQVQIKAESFSWKPNFIVMVWMELKIRKHTTVRYSNQNRTIIILQIKVVTNIFYSRDKRQLENILSFLVKLNCFTVGSILWFQFLSKHSFDLQFTITNNLQIFQIIYKYSLNIVIRNVLIAFCLLG